MSDLQQPLETVSPSVRVKYEQLKKEIESTFEELSKGETRKTQLLSLYASESTCNVHLDVALDCVADGMSYKEVEEYTTSDKFVWDEIEVLNYYSKLTE